MDANMYCPQCGSLNQDHATTCHNCGTTLEDNGTLAQEPISIKAMSSSFGMAVVCLAMGILSFSPYPYLASRTYFPILRQKPFLHSAFELGCLGGIPLGLASIVLGILAWRRSQNKFIIVIMSVIGILLSIGGIIGHTWFIVTCQFCQ